MKQLQNIGTSRFSLKLPVFTFLLLAMFCTLFAQAEEVAEINTENLQDYWLQKLYKELDVGSDLLNVNIRAKMPETGYNVLLAMQSKFNDLQINASIVDEGAEKLLGNFLLSWRNPQTTIREVKLGSYRPAWGSGIVLRNSGSQTKLLKLLPSPHPNSYSPLGLTAVLNEKYLSAFVVSSYQKRNARLVSGNISSLGARKREALQKVEESVLATGVEFHPRQLSLGALLYSQSYSHEFSDPTYTNKLQAASLAAKLSGKEYCLSSELASIEGSTALALSAELNMPRLKQSLGFRFRNGAQMPVYAARAFILSSKGENQELFWNLAYNPEEDFSLGFQQALLRPNHALKNSNWLSRSIVFASYSPGKSRYLLQLTRIDKEIMAELDSSYAQSLPVHYRAKLQLQHSLNPHLSLQVQFYYHYEDKLEKNYNSIYWENALTFRYKKLAVQAGLKTWQSMHSIVIPDEEASDPEGSFAALGDSDRMFISAAWSWRSLRLKAEFWQSWKGENSTLYLNLGL